MPGDQATIVWQLPVDAVQREKDKFDPDQPTMKWFIIFSLFILVAACGNDSPKADLPSRLYHYAAIDTASLADKHAVYVPVYSHIYTETGASALGLAGTLSIRNTSFSDSFYVTDVVYYGSQGELLKRYADSTLLLRPMTSIEFVVERTDTKGGAGANFVVRWGAGKPGVKPLIQSVMVQTATGISLVANGVEMD